MFTCIGSWNKNSIGSYSLTIHMESKIRFCIAPLGTIHYLEGACFLLITRFFMNTYFFSGILMTFAFYWPTFLENGPSINNLIKYIQYLIGKKVAIWFCRYSLISKLYSTCKLNLNVRINGKYFLWKKRCCFILIFNLLTKRYRTLT